MEITLEQVERLRETADVSYGQAKAALEYSGGNLLDASIYLEEQGVIPRPEAAYYSPKNETPPPPPQELPVLQVKPEAKQKNHKRRGVRHLLRWLRRILLDNELEIWRKGQPITAVPMLILLIFVIFLYWIAIPLLILGLFLGFQYPVEIPGVTMANFMKLAVNEQRKFRGEEPLSAAEFLKLMREKSAVVELSSKLTSRAVNEGFSGGEKKKNEIFQMAMLDPKLAILDETDSGLDIDALRIVATGVTKLHRADNATVVITHYQRLLDYIVPDVVHVLYKGRIIHSGDKSLALKLEKEGYDWLINEYDK